jgi:ABC-type sugar transport system substrate-binding protein
MGSGVYLRKLLILLVLVLVSGQGRAETLHISFVVPDEKGPMFWDLVAEIALSAAQDLDVELEVLYSASNRFASKQVIEEIARRDIKPDYIIFRPFQGNAREIFDLLESREISFVTLEQAFEDYELAEIGQPQQKYHHWLGQINYDNAVGGRLLTNALLKHFRKTHPDEVFYITAIGGDFDGVSKNREASLTAGLKAKDKIFVNQIFPMNWSPMAVKERFASIYARYPNTSAYWCAGDQMALEVINQLHKVSMPDKTKYLVGGFDWLPEALEKIKTGEMTASVGGHFLMAANAVIKIVDYHKDKIAFSDKLSLELFELIDNDNVDQYLPFLQKAPWPTVDFKRFSQTMHTGSKVEKLTVANLLHAYTKLDN